MFNIREQVKKQLEVLRESKTIGSSLEATVVLTLDKKVHELVYKYKNSLSEFFIVSDVELAYDVKLDDETFNIEVKKASGHKCVRCWKYSDDVNPKNEKDCICSKCKDALN